MENFHAFLPKDVCDEGSLHWCDQTEEISKAAVYLLSPRGCLTRRHKDWDF